MVGTGRGEVRKSRDLDPGLAMPGPLCTPEQGNGAGMRVREGPGGLHCLHHMVPETPSSISSGYAGHMLPGTASGILNIILSLPTPFLQDSHLRS